MAFIVLMAGTGVPGSQILEAQGQLILKASGSSESQMKTEREIQKRLIDIIAREKDEKIARGEACRGRERNSSPPCRIPSGRPSPSKPGGLSEAAVDAFNNAWFRYFLTYDPRPTLRTVRCPVLAINGEKDLQVPAKENLAEIERRSKAGGNRNVQDGRAARPESSVPALQDRHARERDSGTIEDDDWIRARR